MKRDVVVIGAGPGGLRCAEMLAQQGLNVLVLEKNRTIGKKFCAGGITWSGLIGRVPQKLIERAFCNQHITTRHQDVLIKSGHPVIATVNRQTLGRHMFEAAENAGADIILGARVRTVDTQNVYYTIGAKNFSVSHEYLVGADGSHSRVRAFLGLPTHHIGTGINYNIPLICDEMLWHFDSREFGSGYSWIFPHRGYISAGAFMGRNTMSPSALNKNLIQWLRLQEISVRGLRPQAGKINCDFRGWNFGRTFIVGDAAGLASPLTGEGIFPAILSAETVAETIIDREYIPERLRKLLTTHRKHFVLLKMSAFHPSIALLLSEVSAFLLRHRLLSFKTFEMG